MPYLILFVNLFYYTSDGVTSISNGKFSVNGSFYENINASEAIIFSLQTSDAFGE